MTAWNTFYVGTEVEITAAIVQINSNCGFPDGYCQSWGVPTQAYEQDFWFVMMPSPNGYMEPTRSFTQEQMIIGVENVTQEESQRNWWPPIIL